MCITTCFSLIDKLTKMKVVNTMNMYSLDFNAFSKFNSQSQMILFPYFHNNCNLHALKYIFLKRARVLLENTINSTILTNTAAVFLVMSHKYSSKLYLKRIGITAVYSRTLFK